MRYGQLPKGKAFPPDWSEEYFLALVTPLRSDSRYILAIKELALIDYSMAKCYGISESDKLSYISGMYHMSVDLLEIAGLLVDRPEGKGTSSCIPTK